MPVIRQHHAALAGEREWLCMLLGKDKGRHSMLY
jgi:hypothetical protein